MPRPKKKKVAEVMEEVLKREPYSITVKVLGKLHTATGGTLDEAISNLKIKNAKGMSVWKVSHNGVVRERVIMPAQTFRVFGFHGMARDIVMKHINEIFAI